MTSSIYDYVAPTYGRFDLELVRGQGSWVWDQAGKKYLDFGTGIAVCSLGHCHPKVTKALQAQASTLVHCSNLYRIPQQARLAEILSERIVREIGRCFFCNSGTETNEALIKLARRYGHLSPDSKEGDRYEIITFKQGFHGRTMGGLAATPQAKVQQGFGPLLQGFCYAPLNDLAATREAVNQKTVGVLLEPIQGEGGIRVAEESFLRGLQELCREKDLLLMIDEVQCGIGRTGDLCGFDSILGGSEKRGDFCPDAVGWAKGLAGGIPIGAIWIRDRSAGEGKLSDILGPGSHGSTFGGSPFASAVATSVLEVIMEEDLAANAIKRYQQILKGVEAMKSNWVSSVRGKGLMVGLVLNEERFEEERASKAPGTAASIALVKDLQKAGLLTVPAGTGVVRFLPALNTSAEEVETALYLLHSVLEKWKHGL